MLNIFNSSANQQKPSALVIQAYFKKAANLFESREYKLAIEIYSQIIEIECKSFEAYTERAIVRILQKEWDLALADLNCALSLNISYLKPRYWKGITLARQGLNREAAEEFDKVIADGKSLYPKSYFYRGFVRMKMSLLQSAIIDLSKSISLSENVIESYFWRGIAKYKWGDMTGAVHDLNSSLSLVGENQEFDSIIECIKEYSSVGTVYYSNGIYQAKNGRYHEAQEDLACVKSFFAMEKELRETKIRISIKNADKI